MVVPTRPARRSDAARPSPSPSRGARAARGRPRRAEVDARIRHAAFSQLVAGGYAGLSIEAVAAAAGVAKTTIYRRYPTKRDLAIAALSEAAQVPVVPDDLEAREALDLFVRGAIGALVKSGAARILGSLLVEDRREPGLLEAFRARLVGPRREVGAALLRRGIERREIRPDADPLLVTELIAGAVFGHHVILGQPVDEAWIRGVIDHVWRAIEASPAAARSNGS